MKRLWNHEKIMVLKGTYCNLEILNGQVDDLISIAENQEYKTIQQKLQEIVPEYEPA
jgi:hypothetical protein